MRAALSLATTALSFVLAGAAPRPPPQQWFLVVHDQPPAQLGPFPTEQGCGEELATRRAKSEANWRQMVNEYYRLLAISLDPPDEADKAERIYAYQRVLYYQRIFSLYRAATCEPQGR